MTTAEEPIKLPEGWEVTKFPAGFEVTNERGTVLAFEPLPNNPEPEVTVWNRAVAKALPRKQVW